MNPRDKDTLRLGIPSDLADASRLCECAAEITDTTLQAELLQKARLLIMDVGGQIETIGATRPIRAGRAGS